MHQFGHTGITWANSDIEKAISDISSLGYAGFETFGWVLENWDDNSRRFKNLIGKYNLPLNACYCSANILDTSSKADNAKKCITWCDLIKKNGAQIMVFGGDLVHENLSNRRGFVFEEHKKTIIELVNYFAKVVTDQGVIFTFHPHTGTPIETPEEILVAMNEVDESVVKFAPDVGQIHKGGGDPLKIIKDYTSLIMHIHLKDYIGGEMTYDDNGDEIDRNGFFCYCPLGQGVVQLKEILEYLEKINYPGTINVELDINPRFTSIKPVEAARISRDYLIGLGYEFNIK